MLIQLMIFVNGNWYEDETELARTFTVPEGGDFKQYGADYIRAFEKKNYQSIMLVGMALDPVNDRIEIVFNSFYKHPMKEYIEINKAAKRVRKVPVPAMMHDYDEEVVEEEHDD